MFQVAYEVLRSLRGVIRSLQALLSQSTITLRGGGLGPKCRDVTPSVRHITITTLAMLPSSFRGKDVEKGIAVARVRDTKIAISHVFFNLKQNPPLKYCTNLAHVRS
jgi:hypothetical protein